MEVLLFHVIRVMRFHFFCFFSKTMFKQNVSCKDRKAKKYHFFVTIRMISLIYWCYFALYGYQNRSKITTQNDFVWKKGSRMGSLILRRFSISYCTCNQIKLIKINFFKIKIRIKNQWKFITICTWVALMHQYFYVILTSTGRNEVNIFINKNWL